MLLNSTGSVDKLELRCIWKRAPCYSVCLDGFVELPLNLSLWVSLCGSAEDAKLQLHTMAEEVVMLTCLIWDHLRSHVGKVRKQLKRT